MAVPLEELSGVAAAVYICNTPEMKNKIFALTRENLYESFHSLDSKRSYKEWKFGLKNEAENVLKNYPVGFLCIIPSHLFPLIGLEILEWAEILESEFGLTSKFCREFISSSFFTPKGTIDEEKAARALLNEFRSDTLAQYKIACYYFMADIIPSLWKQLRHKPDFQAIYLDHSSKLFGLWTKYLEENGMGVSSSKSESNSVHTSFLTEAFSYGMKTKNLSAVKYSWNTMDVSKRILKYEDHIAAQNEGFLHLSVYEVNLMCLPSIFSDNLLDFMDFGKDVNILLFFFGQMEKEEIKQFLIHFENIVEEVLHCLLLWPYQSLFLDVVDTGCLFLESEDEGFREHCTIFHSIIQVIISLIEDEDFGDIYDYRDILKQFWIKSPTNFKEFVIHEECYGERTINCLIFINLFKLNNFTLKDQCNYFLLLESVSVENRRLLFEMQGREICLNLISKGNFSTTEMFFRSMDMREESLKTFKKSLASFYFHEVVIKEEKISKADEFVNWMASGVSVNEIKNIKHDIFPKVFNFESPLVPQNNFVLYPGSSFSFLTKLLKWFLVTDCKIEEWKRNLVSTEQFAEFFVLQLMKNLLPVSLKRSDEFLEWVGYFEENLSDFKTKILFKSIPFVVMKLFQIKYEITEPLDERFKPVILYLCSYDAEKINELFKVLRDTCNSYVEENVCLKCLSYYGKTVMEEKLVCYSNDHKEIHSKENLKSIFSSVEKEIKNSLAEKKKRINIIL